MQFPPADRTLVCADHTHHFAQTGSGATTVVLIHGSLCDYRYWRWQLNGLSDTFRVIAPSLRGYWPNAFTRADAKFSIAQHARDLRVFISGINAGRPVHLVGHSRGAQVTLELALAAPDLVASLTLADPGFRLAGEAEAPLPHRDMAALLQGDDADAALSGFVDRVNGAGTWRQMTSWFKTMVRDNAATLLSQAQEPQPVVDPAHFADLPFPLLLLGGANSPSRYRTRLDALSLACPQAHRVTIPLAAHGMNLANPRAFNTALSSFVENTEIYTRV
ncbi:alpha/beta hydrolase [Alcaligenaceae bacterium]|nr:alpha/beta hydrolase [Alcaligenaceae bacterium]